MSAAVRLEHLGKIFPTAGGAATSILEDVSCDFAAKQSTAIVGPSGSGKSTLLNLIGALDTPTAGRIFLGDLEVTALGGSALTDFRARRLGFVFQDHHLLPQLTAEENVLLPTLASKGDDDAARAAALLDLVGVAERRDAFPAQLSGGERQRVAVARALINQPDLLLCDEPTGNLDRATGAAVISLLLQLVVQRGVTLLTVTHNLEQAARFSRCLELSGGKLQPYAPGGERQ